MTTRRYSHWIAASLMLVAAGPALADDMGVMERARPDYDAKGLPMGGFRLKPMLDVGVAADDNVYRTDNDRQSDVFVTVTPRVDLKSDWSNHMLEFRAGLSHARYAGHTKESRTDWNVGTEGRLDILRGTYVNGEADYTVTHEPRYSPDQPGTAAEPTRYSDTYAAMHFTHDPGRLALTFGGIFQRFDYDATPLVGGGLLNNDDRDEDAWHIDAKASFAFSDHYTLFLRGSFDRRDFDQAIDRNGFDRSSHGYAIDAGADLHLTHLIRGEVFAGYRAQTFHLPLSSAAGIDFGAKLTWYATPLLTAHLSARRAFTDTTIFGASVSDDRIFDAGLDYELLRDLILQADIAYTDSRFIGTARDDTLLDASIEAQYLVNRSMRLYLHYLFSHRASSAMDQDFGDNTVSVGVRFAL